MIDNGMMSATDVTETSVSQAMRCVRLDDVDPALATVGYGSLGRRGDLGYEGKRVVVAGREWMYAVSAHAPSRLVYRLNRMYRRFRCEVAINDDVSNDVTGADFFAIADGRVAGVVRNVRPRQQPRQLDVAIDGAMEFELVVQPHRWENCHSVWLNPILVEAESNHEVATIIDGLRRAEIEVPVGLPEMELCIATVGSPGFEGWIDDLFGSVRANAHCPCASLAIFMFGESDGLRQVAAKYQATTVACRPLKALNCASKAVLYAAGRVLPAKKFICLDADMLILDDLRPIVSAIDAAPPGAILTCREANGARDVQHAYDNIYAGEKDRLGRLLGSEVGHEAHYPLVVNDGIFAGTRAALCGLDDLVGQLTNAAEWVDDPARNMPWRNQFIFNLALARGRIGMELDPRFNVQLNMQDADARNSLDGIEATTTGRTASILHFNGGGRSKCAEVRGRFRSVAKPLRQTEKGTQAYGHFTDALRRWIGLSGLDAMAWSFYGTSDARSAVIPDGQDFPLLATLHFLIRTNGCIRVLETGTARGVSTACLASAVSHRTGASVTTFDVRHYSERDTLWSLLPEAMRDCIEPITMDSVEGLRQLLRQNRTFHAALLDSLHDAGHILKEFELARQLVCRDGLIVIHDINLVAGSVEAALTEIERQGFGVTRLWSASEGVREDDNLGLALVANRKR